MIFHLRVLFASCLVILAPALIAAELTLHVELRDASIGVPVDNGFPDFPAVAQNQDRTIGQARRSIGVQYMVEKDIPPPPCEPHWYNGWCAFSSTSTCKNDRTCVSEEGLCLESTGSKCYTYQDSSGTQRCNGC